ncbi:molecular chaperone TorD, partial [Escherichia coli]
MQSALDAMQDDLNTRMLKRGAADFEALHWDFT